MRACALVAVIALASLASAQVTFDFEGVTLQDLVDAGWVFIDDQLVTIDSSTVPPTTTTYPGTIQIETTIVHGGAAALRLGYRDLAYFGLGKQFGTLDLWAFDYGYRLRAYLNGSSAYGPRFGFRKFDTAGNAYGIGAGLADRSSLDSDGGYGAELGVTENYDLASPSGAPHPNCGWAGDQSWWSPDWFAAPGGRPPAWDGNPGTGGWNHWRISYLAPSQIVIELVESWNGGSAMVTVTQVSDLPAWAQGSWKEPFNGMMIDGLDDIFLYGGRSGIDGETLFGDGIFDDITWTPAPSALQADFDLDGDVDLDDFVILKKGFATGTTHAEGDADRDGDVDLDDFVILKKEFAT